MSASVPRCPVCDQPIDPNKPETRPFCSQRCKQIDLGRWLGERYGFPYERPYDAEGLEGQLPEDE